MDEDKIRLANKAISLISTDAVVGLGASSTMKYLVDCLWQATREGMRVRLLTSSYVTRQLLLQKGLVTDPIGDYSSIDTYFDGCDQFDKQLNAVKSGGGIHTTEKILAAMANKFILLADAGKYVEKFHPSFPLVLEVLPEACRYVQEVVTTILPDSSTTLRMSDKKIGPAITDHGNYLVDTWFKQWPSLEDLTNSIAKITGVVETSLFYQLAHAALIGGQQEVTMLTK